MVEPIYLDAIIFSSLLTLLSIGLTVTYLTSKVPNFAHGTLAAIGAYVTLTVAMVWKSNVYYSFFLAFIIAGATALAQYIIILRPLMRRGWTSIGLMVATLAFETILSAVLNIYADYCSSQFKVRSRLFILRTHDICVAGQRGILIVAPTLAAVVVMLLYLAFTRTMFGVAMRAVVENPSLASVMGINVNLVYSVSWFLAGALAGLSGASLPLHFLTTIGIGVTLTVSIFAASVVGGILNVYGAVLGGVLIGFAEILGTSYLASWQGVWIIPYRPLVPLIALVVTLLLAPKGVLGVNWPGVIRGIRGLAAYHRFRARGNEA